MRYLPGQCGGKACADLLFGRANPCGKLAETWPMTYADVPTDCPTRERHGWTGDAQIFVNTATYLFGYGAFARKYIADMRDGQHRNGCYRQISPKGAWIFT